MFRSFSAEYERHTAARFCAPSSELQIAESRYDKTAPDDLLGVPADKVNDDRLYRALDALLSHKDALCRHLQDRYGALIGETFDFPFYGITSTYFEGIALGSARQRVATAVTPVLTVRNALPGLSRAGKDYR